MNEPDHTSTNLIDRKWLLVRRLDGHIDEVSLLDVFHAAPRVAALVGEVPTQVFALTRLLLAVLHRAVDGPSDVTEWKALWDAPELPVQQIARYLDAHHDRFDLRHPATPFLQVADLHTEKGEVSELAKLVADIPNGRPFFSGRLERDLTLSFGEAARWLVHCQAFNPSGIKSGAVGDPRVKSGKGYPIGTGWSGQLGGLMPEGRTLRETLLLNLIARDFTGLADLALSTADVPAWERPAVDAAEDTPPGSVDPRSPTGPIDLYTWQSRRVRLFWRDDHAVGVLICNGDRTTPQNRHILEPHTAWRRSEAQEKKLRRPQIYMPRMHDPKRAIWRGLRSILPATADAQGADAAAALSPAVLEWVSYLTELVIDPNHPLRVRTLGMVYGSNNSVTDEIIDDALSLRAVLLRRDAAQVAGIAVACVDAADRVARTVGALAGNLASAAGGDPAGPRDRANETAFAELDVLFRTWLSELGPDSAPTDEQLAWHRQARRVAVDLGDDLMARAPAVAWVGRSVKGRWLTSNHAWSRFRRDLHAAVPLAFDSTAAA
jgi:CRISPR system Cascade subunit CasA